MYDVRVLPTSAVIYTCTVQYCNIAVIRHAWTSAPAFVLQYQAHSQGCMISDRRQTNPRRDRFRRMCTTLFWAARDTSQTSRLGRRRVSTPVVGFCHGDGGGPPGGEALILTAQPMRCLGREHHNTQTASPRRCRSPLILLPDIVACRRVKINASPPVVRPCGACNPSVILSARLTVAILYVPSSPSCLVSPSLRGLSEPDLRNACHISDPTEIPARRRDTALPV